MFGAREITNSRSIFPLQPTGLPSPMSGIVPRSSTSVVPPVPDSPEPDPPDDVELLPVLVPVLSAAVVSVEPAGTVVVGGVLEKPDESEVGAWQAPTMASNVSRGQRVLMRRILARSGSASYAGVAETGRP